MTIKYTIEKHGVAYPTKMLASNGGAHIFNLECDKPIDNGMIVAKGDWKGMEYYGVKDATGVTGVVLEKSARGNWYVEIENPADGLMIYMPPLIENTSSHTINKECNFFNNKGEIVSGFQLCKGDIVEVSVELFDKAPTAKKTLTLENRKWKVGE